MKKLLSMAQVTAATTLSSTSIYRLVKSGAFPQPLKLQDRTVAWVEEEVSAWIEKRIIDGKAEYAAEEGQREKLTAIRHGKSHNVEVSGPEGRLAAEGSRSTVGLGGTGG